MTNSATAAGINANGHHYVCRGGDFRWMHPLEMLPGDIDCTFMSDEEFEQCVGEQVPVSIEDQAQYAAYCLNAIDAIGSAA